MMLATIFQDLEHLNDFNQSAMVAILVLKMRPKLFTGKTFSMITPFNLEAGVKGQIQHLEKISRL